MKILCTDLEGTLAPEIWQEIGRNYNIPELSATTREIPDFEDLMNMRMEASIRIFIRSSKSGISLVVALSSGIL